MFKFDFEVDEDPDLDAFLVPRSEHGESVYSESKTGETSSSEAAFSEQSLEALLRTLPATISFSPIHILLPDKTSISLSRRDLFDARFQLISSDSQSEEPSGQEPEDLKFVEAPSDLIPGVYEGGLKTWECSIDLAGQIHELIGDFTDGQRILELGCGTAIPSIRILHDIFAQTPAKSRRISIHLQDYNELVFRLTVLPNIILAWYMSPAANAFRESPGQRVTSNTDEEDGLPSPDPSQPGDLPISAELIEAFTSSLEQYGVELRFFSGSWESFDLQKTGGKYNIVFTSETIYRIESLPSLLDVMWRACSENLKCLEDLTESLQISTEQANPPEASCTCVVAAKLVYFGVGGGVTEFVNTVEKASRSQCGRRAGTVDTVWKTEEGVKRVIMKVQWK